MTSGFTNRRFHPVTGGLESSIRAAGLRKVDRANDLRFAYDDAERVDYHRKEWKL